MYKLEIHMIRVEADLREVTVQKGTLAMITEMWIADRIYRAIKAFVDVLDAIGIKNNG